MTYNTYPGVEEAMALDPVRDEESGYPHAVDPPLVQMVLGRLGAAQEIPVTTLPQASTAETP